MLGNVEIISWLTERKKEGGRDKKERERACLCVSFIEFKGEFLPQPAFAYMLFFSANMIYKHAPAVEAEEPIL